MLLLFRGGCFVDFSNFVCDEGFKFFFFVGDILKDCYGICLKGGVVDWKV